ncbi:MAG: hypothetical protein J6B09_07055 [Clostridia bacterium]|nr:hypothetical protein [Clostridia bacterium]
MKRKCRILVCLIAAIMIVSALPLAVFAQDGEPESAVDYVTSGLVSRYDADDRGTTDGVWEDLVGTNDIEIVNKRTDGKGSVAFTDDGLKLSSTWCDLPEGINTLLRGTSFTMEFLMGDIVQGHTFHGIIGASNDSATLFIHNNGNLYLKSRGEISGARPTVPGGLALFKNSLLTATYDTVAQTAVIYVNGVEMGREVISANAFMADTVIAALGYTGTNRDGQERTYRSIRFYNRALSVSEIETNAFVDGFLRYREDTQYVSDGLVSHYDGVDRGTADGVWKDLVGTNDITVASGAGEGVGTIAFQNNGLYIKDTYCDLPDGIDAVLKGTSFTMEFLMGDIVQGHKYHTILGAPNDELGLFITSSVLYLKSPGETSNKKRPSASGGLDVFGNALISVTYDTVAKTAAIYINGVEMGRNVLDGDPALVSSFATLGYSGTDNRANQERTYRSIRFYNRVLSASEIMQNAYVDGMHPGIAIAQPVTNIVGDMAMTRDIGSAAELAEMMAADRLPAAAIYRINSELFVTDGDGNAFARLFDVIKQTEFKVLPVVIPEDLNTVNALVVFIKEIGFYDISILTKDAELLKAVRAKMPALRGALDLTDVYKDRSELTKDDLINIRKTANINGATVVLLPAALATKDNVQHLYNRQINVWVGISDTPTAAEKYNALLSGAVGVISDDTAGLLDIALALPANTMTRSPLNGGHRGIPSKAPENTVEGSILAWELGANYVEMDVLLSKDNKVVVCHDSTTNRTCDQNYTVENENYVGVLEHVKANKGFENDPLYKDCKLPLLDDYFEYFKNTDCLMVVEIKSGNTNIVPYVKALTEQYNMYDQVFVISFKANIRATMRELWPEMSVGYLTNGILSETDADRTAIDAMNALGSDSTSFNPQIGSLSSKAARATLLRGFQVNTWGGNIGSISLAKFLASGLPSFAYNQTDYFGSAVQSFAANLPEKLLLGKSAVISMDLLTYANVDTGDLINVKDVTVTVLEGADLVTVNGNTLTASGLGTVTFMVQYSYDYTDHTDATQTISLCTQPITLTVVQGTLIEGAIADADYAKNGVVVADRACEAGAGNKYVSAEQMQVLNAAIAAAEEKKETATTNEEITAAVKALTDVLALFNEAIQTGDTHRGEATNSTECKYGCGTMAVAYVLDAEGNPIEGFYPTLEDAIAAANTNGGTITLLKDVVINDLTTTIEITTNVIIDGGESNYSITVRTNTKNNLYAFTVTGTSDTDRAALTLKNLKISYTHPTSKIENGSMIYLGSQSELYVNNCELTTNNAIFVVGGYSRVLNVKNSICTSTSYYVYYTWRGGRSSLQATFDTCVLKSEQVDVSNIGVVYINGYAETGATYIFTNTTLIATSKIPAILVAQSPTIIFTGTVTVSVPDGCVLKQSANQATVKFGAEGNPFTDTQIIRQNGTTYYFYDTVDAAFTAKQDGDSIFSYAASSVQNKGYVIETATDANSNTYYTVGAIDTSLIESAIANASDKKNGIAQAEKPCEAGVGNKYVSAAQMQALNQAIAAAEAKKASATTSGAVIEAVQALNDALASFETAILTGVAHKDDGMDHVCDYGCDVYQGVHADSANDNDHDCEYCGERLNDCTPNEDDGDCTTAITCSVCGAVTTAAKAAHTPAEDDGDCTTAITCTECGTVTTAAKAAHTPGEDDGDCTTAVYCTECEKVATAAKAAHTGGTATCTAKAACSICGKAYGELTQHTYDSETDASCNVCGAERAVENQTNGNENTANGNENNAQNGNTEAPAKQGLSSGAIAGIVIGAVAVIGALAVTAVFVVKKKKQTK